MVIGWFKSTFSGAEKTCVEVAHRGDAVLVRDSKYAGPAESQPIISVPSDLWAAVLEAVLSGESGCVGAELSIEPQTGGGAILKDRRGLELSFTAGEWDAFAKGVADGQFQVPSN